MQGIYDSRTTYIFFLTRHWYTQQPQRQHIHGSWFIAMAIQPRFSCLRLFPHLLVKIQNSFLCMC